MCKHINNDFLLVPLKKQKQTNMNRNKPSHGCRFRTGERGGNKLHVIDNNNKITLVLTVKTCK